MATLCASTLRLAGARLRCQRRDPHAQHQRANMAPTGTNALPGQLVAQLTGTHEQVFQVQFADLAH